jgi:phosphatidate phosphatase PAH1
LKSSKFSNNKKDRLKIRNIEEENPAFFEVENVDGDSPRIELHNDVYVTDSVISVSTPSLLVKGRYAKKKDHWNFIQQQRRDANVNTRGEDDL